MTFRFDDVCTNTDMDLHHDMTSYLFDKFPGCNVIWAISPLAHSGCGTRVFPKIWNAHSDYKIHYNLDKVSIPEVKDSRVIKATHGLIHVDHRLLTKEAQELSILLSASLVGAEIFVPPFNKWNKDTEDICKENGIKLIKFEDGWESMEYNTFGNRNNMLYLHAREWTLESFKNWFK